MPEILIRTGNSSGSVETTVKVGSSLQGDFHEFARDFQRVLVVISKQVNEKHRNLVDGYVSGITDCSTFVMDDGESAKSLEGYEKVISGMSSAGLSRKDLVAYIGGGTIGDVVGFAASTYGRGVHLCAIPTTILSQVDSSIGGKNGINFLGIKNLVGTFHNPALVLCDSDFLVGMDQKTLKESISEIIKCGLIGDREILLSMREYNSIADLISENLEDLIARSIEVKKSVIEKDPLEREGLRQILNAGHTLAHALESASSNEISHGKAVLIGLLGETEISASLSRAGLEANGTVREMVERYRLDTDIPGQVTAEAVLSFIRKDKKIEDGKIVFPLMVEPGKATLATINLEQLLSEMESWCRRNLKGRK